MIKNILTFAAGAAAAWFLCETETGNQVVDKVTKTGKSTYDSIKSKFSPSKEPAKA